MAGSREQGWQKQSTRTVDGHKLRVLTAAATRVNMSNRAEILRQRGVRQIWQTDGFSYRNSIGEIRYALNFLANCAARMRIFIAVLPDTGESDTPVDIDEFAASNPGLVPTEILEACHNAMRDFGNGRLALAGHMRATSTNLSIAGEGFVLGQEDPLTGAATWSIRSISEVVVYNDKLCLREGPVDSTGMLGLVELDEEFTSVSRFWNPDPQFRILADSPMRAILNECEALLILRRMIRATGRSRLAGRGLLLWPEELSLGPQTDDNDDPLADPTMERLAMLMMTPISNEGDASSVVPGIVRGPGDILDKIRHLKFDDSFDQHAGATRDELVGVIATGLDVPKAVVLGMADMNHWTAWQVSDDTFREHVEPHVITIVDCHTGAFLRPYLETSNLPPALAASWIPRLMFWYDPTELVTHPDRTANAKMLHDSIAISDAAYRDALGFTDDDAPSAEEIELRMVRNTRNWPVNALVSLLHTLDPALNFPAITQTGMIPGLAAGPGGGVLVPAVLTPDGSQASLTGTPADPTGNGAPVAVNGPPDAAAAALVASAALASPDGRAAGIRAVRYNLLTLHNIDPYKVAETAARTDEFVTTREMFAEGFAKMEAALGAKMEAFMATEKREPEALVASAGPIEVRPSAESIALSRRLAVIDSQLRDRLVVAANSAMLRYLEKVGNQARQKAAPNAELRAKVAQSRAEHVLTLLGRDVVASMNLTAAALTGKEWDTFKSQFYSWTAQAQEQAMKTSAKLSGKSLTELVATVNTQMFATAQDASWGMLEAAMNSLAHSLPYAADPNLTEADIIAGLNPDTLVPTGTIRAALGAAGGAPSTLFGMVPNKAGEMVPGVPLGVPVGGIATGATINGILTANGATAYSYEWVHGPSARPFDPHEILDGTVFSDWTDPALANAGDFPNNSFFMPGDHNGCLCDAVAQWVTQQDVNQAMADAYGGTPDQYDAPPDRSGSWVKDPTGSWVQPPPPTPVITPKVEKVTIPPTKPDYVATHAKVVEGKSHAVDEYGNYLTPTDLWKNQKGIYTQAVESRPVTKLSDAQFAALRAYTRDSTAMNASLWKENGRALYGQEINTKVSNLKRAISAQPVSSEPVIIKRVSKMPAGLQEGQSFETKTFWSTSLPGGQFKTPYNDEWTIFADIPAGTKFMDVNAVFTKRGAHYHLAHEAEALFPPGSNFRIDAINVKTRTMKLTYIPKGSK